MKKKLAIFDMDGTLFDTQPANYAAYKATLALHGFELTEEYFIEHCFGYYYQAFLPPIIGDDPVLLETIHEEKGALYPQFYHKIRENKALFALMPTLRKDYHIALVSAAAKRSVYDILDQFGRRGEFDLILTQQDVVKKKPDPQGFLTAMEHFGVGPEDTIIFEDAADGIEAAQRSGAFYLVVKDILD